MVVKVISESVSLPERPPRAGLGKRVRRLFGGLNPKNALVLSLGICLGAAILFLLTTTYSSAKDVITPGDAAVGPALDRIDARMDEALRRIDDSMRVGLQTMNGGGLPSTDRAAVREDRPWTISGEGLRTVDSRDSDVRQATEIHVSTDLSEQQVKALAAAVDEQFVPKLNAMMAKVDSHLDQQFKDIAARHGLTDAELSALKLELNESVGVVLRDEMTRNEELWEDNATYRVLFQRSLDLNQDLIALYAGSVKDDHALGNVVKVVPKLFTLQVWQNRDNQEEYLRLLGRYEELATGGYRMDETKAAP
jgi:hypothetical protein